MFDPKTIGVGVDYRPKAAAQEAQRILEKAIAIGGSDTPEMAPLKLDRNLEDREVGMEIGRVLYAIERPYLSTLVFELVGDQALASDNNDLAERAYREGWFVAHEEYLRPQSDLRSEAGGGRAADLRGIQAGRRAVAGEGRQGGRLAAFTFRSPLVVPHMEPRGPGSG